MPARRALVPQRAPLQSRSVLRAPPRVETIEEEFARLAREVEQLRRQQAADDSNAQLAREMQRLRVDAAREEGREHEHERAANVASAKLAREIEELRLHAAAEEAREHEHERSADAAASDTQTQINAIRAHIASQEDRYSRLQRSVDARLASFAAPVSPIASEAGGASDGGGWGATPQQRGEGAPRSRPPQDEYQPGARRPAPTVSFSPSPPSQQRAVSSGAYRRGIGSAEYDRSWADTFVSYMHARDEELGVQFERPHADDGHHGYHSTNAAMDAVLYYSTHVGDLDRESDEDSFAVERSMSPSTSWGARATPKHHGASPLAAAQPLAPQHQHQHQHQHHQHQHQHQRQHTAQGGGIVDLVSGLLSPEQIAP